MKIEREPFSYALFDELQPLAQRCWDEGTAEKAQTCAFYGEREFAIEPNRDLYELMESRGEFVMVTLRDEGKLVGYVEGFLYRSPHHKSILCGNVDSAYVEPEHRSHAVALIGRFERELKDLGVNIVGWPTHPNGSIYKLLTARGYVGDDVIMEKKLCAP